MFKSGIYLKSDEEIAIMQESAVLVSETLAEVAKVLKPGINGIWLDQYAEDFIRSKGAVPSFKNYRGFKYSLCISVNDAVVHGLPNDISYKEGDIISVDCGVYKNGFHGDSAYTFSLGIAESDLKLLTVTKQSLMRGISKALAGNRVGDISHEIQSYCEANGYSVVRELVGHGIGKNLHEEPDVPNYGSRGKGPLLKENLVIAIEPMINQGTKNVLVAEDQWTIVTKDRKLSAHYEHTVVVKKDQPQVLTRFDIIEEEIKKNSNLQYIP